MGHGVIKSISNSLLPSLFVATSAVSAGNSPDIHAVSALTASEQVLLQLVAIIYEPVSVRFLSRCLAHLDPALFGEHKPNQEEVGAMVTRLRAKGFLSSKNQCPAPLAEFLVRQAVTRQHFARIAALVEKMAPVNYLHGKWSTRCWRAVRQFRIGLYSSDFDKLDDAVTFLKSECSSRLPIEPPAVSVVARAFDPLWFASLPGSMQFFLLHQIIRYALDQLCHFPLIVTLLEDEEHLNVSPDERIPFRRLLAEYYLMQGRLEHLDNLLKRHGDSFLGSGFAGSLAFLSGDTEGALELFEADLLHLEQYADAQPFFFLGNTGLFCIFALLSRNHAGDRQRVREALITVLNRCHDCGEELLYRFLDAFLCADDADLPDMLVLTEKLATEKRSLTLLVAMLCLHWMGVEIPPRFLASLQRLHQKALDNEFLWVAMESAELLATVDESCAPLRETAQELSQQLRSPFLTHIITPSTSWKQSLHELIEVTNKIKEAERTTRLCWLVEYTNDTLKLTPKEQRRSAAGHWSKGRSIAFKRLFLNREVDYLTAQDRLVCEALIQTEDGGGRNRGYHFDLEKALPALIGHPLVFMRHSPRTPVEIVAGEPELVVERREESLFIRFLQDIGTGTVAVWQETPTRFRIIRIRDEHRQIAEITGREGLLVPLAASGQLLDAIGSIASFMTVHSAIEVPGGDIKTEQVESDSTIHIHIIPYSRGFRIEFFVRPFTDGGPYLKPGVGVANLVSEVGGKRLRTKRNLRLEEEKAQEIEESCPMLDLAIDFEQENRREWHLVDPEECLQVLLEIEEIRDKVVLEWPEGGKLAVRRQAGINQLNLNIRTSQQDWFSLSGQLKVDQDEVIELKVLLDKVKAAQSRFIPMGEGQFLALTQEFRHRLEELILYGDSHPGNEQEVKVHPLAAIALEEWAHQAKTKVDGGWQKRLQAIAEAQQLTPKLPSTLKAELRDYQKEGFVWMSRLAHLGIGACLADDMGLGKTLQSLAVLLSFAHLGPSLVVAPTSVCMNWQAEIGRFAPTLNVCMFSELNRKEAVEALGRFDVLIASYTLLHQEIERLATVRWQSIVLDEAQAIKNAATKRSKAAMRLNGSFRLITTGTPIENHLGELWNLFNFINPGLLGTFKQFNRRFGLPIEKHRDRKARRALKKLIMPFMLRRIKSDVLEELPLRTEITLRVELQPEEMQFYEAIRQQAIENIEAGTERTGRHLQILAEIMRLRRACCHPKLINDQIDIPSTKLQVFAETVEELLGGGHKALVFSQFTGHLALIRSFLDEQGITYKYLDGRTPAKERQQQVESFQAGDADLFLISLKAGGLGLNLTAADYVIHMDPWWNPAVEDQAADRAHRIGQKRPVTVYRLVTVNTIEEKIVRLHQEKRDLADSLLEGADVSARISAEELLELIRGG
ncbi:DEAD/DEAH box helicase [Desulfobulbus oligotrophicus]|uniref:DEAD/DEAH box helicase n=1 Tax=Desulfobulbus oligotrophicus TaxID=1909699 RepID=A0A7T6AQ73_9BACT|nr:DEAD/DEAH box helicase [Desulfobulbus oligotrophicus]